MPRIPDVEADDASDEVRAYYARDVERFGRVLGNTRVYAHNEPVLRAVKQLIAGYAETAALPLAIKSLLRTRVAALNGCPF